MFYELDLVLGSMDSNFPRVTPSISRDKSVEVSRGFVKKGYEPLRETFERLAREGQLHRAQCCVYVRGDKVAELWTSQTLDPDDYGNDYLQNIFSSSKVLTSLVVAMLVDRGRLRYDQLVCDLWPEYGQHGKEQTTVANVMRHESGVHRFDFAMATEDLTPERIRAGSLSDRIAAQKPVFPPGSKRRYNAFCRGNIINEIVRRADEHGRTVGQFLRDEVAIPLGLADELMIGAPDRLHGKIVPLCETSRVWWSYYQMLMPRFLGGGKIPFSEFMLRLSALTFYPFAKLSNPLGLGTFIFNNLNSAGHLECPENPDREGKTLNVNMFNMPSTRRAELPSANGHASARALATVAAAVVGGGSLGSVQLLSEEGAKAAQADPLYKPMLFGVLPSYFTNAGWNEYGKERFGYVGWHGFGGSVCQWHPELKIGFGFAMDMIEPDGNNARAASLQQVAAQCAARQQPIRSKL